MAVIVSLVLALALRVLPASASIISVVDPDCPNDLPSGSVSLSYLGPYEETLANDVQEGFYAFQRVRANDGISPESPAVCGTAATGLTSPCTLSYYVTKYEDDMVSMMPGVSVVVGPPPRCPSSHCLAGVGSLLEFDPDLEGEGLIGGSFFMRGSDDTAFNFTAVPYEPEDAEADNVDGMLLALTFIPPDSEAAGLQCTLLYEAVEGSVEELFTPNQEVTSTGS